MIAGLIAIAKVAGTAAAQAGASYGTQTLLGKIFGDQSSKKAANFANDINANTINANSLFDSIKSGVNYPGAPGALGTGYSFQYQSGEDAVKIYRTLLSDEEIEGLRDNLTPLIQKDPYYGGLGNSYYSDIGKTTFNTVPAIGIMQQIDAYINARDKQTQSQAANNSSGLIKYDDLFTQLKKELGLDTAQAATTQETLSTPATSNYSKYLLIGALMIGGIFLIRRK